jgi:hypothetical protein
MGKAILRSGGTGGGGGGGVITPPNAGTVNVTGAIDPMTGVISVVAWVSLASGDSITQAWHFYLEIPDRSGGSAYTVGSTTLGAAAVTGSWSPIDLGVKPISTPQPVALTTMAPADLNPAIDVQARLYVSSVTASVDNPLVEAGQPGATPSVSFTIISGTSDSPVGGSNVTDVSGPITAAVLTPDSSTGVLLWPVLVTVSSIPSDPGWSAQLVVTWQGKDPTLPANQVVVSQPFTTSGSVYGSPDKIATPHSFTLTSKTIQQATVWVQSGLMNAAGAYVWNNIVPGITPATFITVGAVNGRTIDGTAVTPTSIAIDAFAAGIRPVSIFTSNPPLPDPNYPTGAYGLNITTNTFLKVNAAGNAWIPAINGGTDIQAGTVTATQIDASILNAAQVAAAYVTTSYLSANYLTATQVSATYVSATYLSANYLTASTISSTYVTSTYLTANYLTASQIVSTYVTTSYLTANYATITQLNAKTISANNITTGTCTASVSFTAASLQIVGSGFTLNINPSVALRMTMGTVTIFIDASNWIRIYDSLTGNASQLGPAQLSTQNVNAQMWNGNTGFSGSKIVYDGSAYHTVTVSNGFINGWS